MIDLSSHQLGETDELIEVEFREDLRDLILAMGEQAQHRILIFSHDLDKSLYGAQELYEAIKTLAVKSHRTHIQILLHDAGSMTKNGHRLLELARRISSHISIKVTSNEYKDVYETFVVFDDRGYVVQEHHDRYEGSGNFYAPGQTRLLSEQFHEMWERAVVDSTLRRLSL